MREYLTCNRCRSRWRWRCRLLIAACKQCEQTANDMAHKFSHILYSLYTYSYIHLIIMYMGSATNAGCKPEMLQLQLGNGRRQLADSFVDATRSLLTRLQCVFVHRLLNSPTTWFARCVSPMHRCQRSLRLR